VRRMVGSNKVITTLAIESGVFIKVEWVLQARQVKSSCFLITILFRNVNVDIITCGIFNLRNHINEIIHQL